MLERIQPRPVDATGIEGSGAAAAPARFGLATRILLLTAAVVMIAEVAIYIPSIASFRNAWLRSRLASAQTAALVFDAVPTNLPDDLSARLLDSVGARIVVLTTARTRRLLAVSDPPPSVVNEVYDLRDPSPVAAIVSAFRCLFGPAGRMLSVLGESPTGSGTLEITLDETPLRQALRIYSADVLLQSLVISVIVAALAVAAIHMLVLRPVRRLTSSIVAFGNDPEDASGIVAPSSRRDEIGHAEAALRGMQGALVRELGQRKHLAALGLAVAKINHDLRNMLASAQLVSDRLSGLSDPLTRRLAPKLVGTLDRAIAFCEATLAYGRAVEPPPALARIGLHPVVGDVLETLWPAGTGAIVVENEVPDGLQMTADPDQLFRILINLCRNAAQALDGAGPEPGRAAVIRISARRENATVAVEVADNGPGIAPAARAGLFTAFRGVSRAGRTGLGLAIASDLVRAHGGSIALLDVQPGATFRLVFPDRPAQG